MWFILTAGGILPWKTRQRTGHFASAKNKRVVVHAFVTTGTVEEKIDALIESKSSWRQM